MEEASKYADIEKKTNGIITDVLSNRLINQSTEIILINCIYFLLLKIKVKKLGIK